MESIPRRRGPYRKQKRTPRQTRFYRKRRDEPDDDSNNLQDDEETSGSGSTSGVTVTGEAVQFPELYSGSILTTNTSSLAISSYISRHHLSKQAQEDLLQLLRLHVPSTTELLPSSLYSFKKNSVVYDLGSVEQVYHYFCPTCHVTLPDVKCPACPSSLCGIPLSEHSIISFSSISVGDQVKSLLNREYFSQIMYLCPLV